MRRLLIHVEGQTERAFVDALLRDHLVLAGYHSVEARIVGSARQSWRGGIRAWPLVRAYITHHLREDQGCLATTMVDYYGLPSGGNGAWPGRNSAPSSGTAEEKARHVETALLLDMADEAGDRISQSRFLPFVTMHEFEALLFSDCDALSRAIGYPELKPDLQKARSEFTSPEEINDSPDSAPSKRIEAIVAWKHARLVGEAKRFGSDEVRVVGYRKPVHGVDAAKEIGLATIRKECPHFNSWLTKLEDLVA